MGLGLATTAVKCYAKSKYDYAKKKKRLQVNTFIISFRTQLVTGFVKYAAKVFLENHKDIFSGKYNKALEWLDLHSKPFEQHVF